MRKPRLSNLGLLLDPDFLPLEEHSDRISTWTKQALWLAYLYFTLNDLLKSRKFWSFYIFAIGWKIVYFHNIGDSQFFAIIMQMW